MWGKSVAHGECDDCQDLGSNTARVMVSHAVGPRLRNILRLLEIYATLIAVILVSCIIILECFVAVYKIPYVFPMLPYIPLFPYIPPHLVGEIEVLLQVYYIMLIVVVVGCVGVLFYRAVHKSKKAKNSGTKSIHKTALFEIVMLFAIKMCITIICVKIEIAKISINTPISYFLESSDWIQMFSLLNAPVSEEITYRVVDIGIPALIVALIMRKRGALLWKYLAGGFGMSKSAVFFIFLSSFMFGLAHVAGWGGWKFYTEFISGLMLGYLFVKYGFYASVAMHFLTDYMVADAWLFGSSMMIIGPLAMIAVIVAVPGVCLYVGKGATFFKNFTRKGNLNF